MVRSSRPPACPSYAQAQRRRRFWKSLPLLTVWFIVGAISAQDTTYLLEIEAWRSEAALEYRPEALAAVEPSANQIHQPGVPIYSETLAALQLALVMHNPKWFARFAVGQTPTYNETLAVADETLTSERRFDLKRRELGLQFGWRLRDWVFFGGLQHIEFEEHITEDVYTLIAGEERFDLRLPSRSTSSWDYRGGCLGISHYEPLENTPLLIYAAVTGVWLQGEARYDNALLDLSDAASPIRTGFGTTRRDTELTGITLEAAVHWRFDRNWQMRIGYRHRDWDESDDLVLPQVRNGDAFLALGFHF